MLRGRRMSMACCAPPPHTEQAQERPGVQGSALQKRLNAQITVELESSYLMLEKTPSLILSKLCNDIAKAS